MCVEDWHKQVQHSGLERENLDACVEGSVQLVQ
jgi:hypothetical protein